MNMEVACTNGIEAHLHRCGTLTVLRVPLVCLKLILADLRISRKAHI